MFLTRCFRHALVSRSICNGNCHRRGRQERSRTHLFSLHQRLRCELGTRSGAPQLAGGETFTLSAPIAHVHHGAVDVPKEVLDPGPLFPDGIPGLHGRRISKGAGGGGLPLCFHV